MNNDIQERCTSQKRVPSVAWGYETKILLYLQVLPDFYLHLRGFDWNRRRWTGNRRRSTGWAFAHSQVAELWMEFGFQP